MVNQTKSASNNSSEKTFGDKLDDITGYKYFSILEDFRNVIEEENKKILEDNVTEQTTSYAGQNSMLWTCSKASTSLHLIEASTLNYYIGLLPYEPKKLDEMDKKMRRFLSKFKVMRKATNMNRLYLRKDKLRRRLVCLEKNAEVTLVKLYEFLNENSNTQALVEHERKGATYMGLIQDYLQKKYNLNEEEVNAKMLS